GLAGVARALGREGDAMAALGVPEVGGQGCHLAGLPPQQLLDELVHEAVVAAGVAVALPMAEGLVAVRVRGGPGDDPPRRVVRQARPALGITIPTRPVVDRLAGSGQERAHLDLTGVEATADLAVRAQHPD